MFSLATRAVTSVRSGRARVGEQLCREGRADPSTLLVLVRHLEGDLGARAVAHEPREGDRALVTLEVRDEDVTRRIDRSQVLELDRAQPRLGAVEAGAARPLPEPFEHGRDRVDVPVSQLPHDEPRRPPRLQIPGLHHARNIGGWSASFGYGQHHK